MKPKHTITLSKRQKVRLKNIIQKGSCKARVITRARVLLKSAQGMIDADIAREEDIHQSRVERIRSRFVARGLDGALFDAPRPGQPKKLNEKAEKHLLAIACTDPPKGADHWTLELLAEKMVKDKKVKSISSVAIMHYLHRNDTQPWREKNVVYSRPYTGVHSENGRCARPVCQAL